MRSKGSYLHVYMYSTYAKYSSHQYSSNSTVLYILSISQFPLSDYLSLHI